MASRTPRCAIAIFTNSGTSSSTILTAINSAPAKLRRKVSQILAPFPRPRTAKEFNPEPPSPRSSRPAKRAQSGVLHLRDLWGKGKLDQLDRESKHENEPEYGEIIPVDALGDLFAERTHSAVYLTWPRLPELFPVSFPGIKTSRDSLVVDIGRDRLEDRMKRYFDPMIADEEFAEEIPEAMADGYMYPAREIRAKLRERGFRPWEILRYCYRPFDTRWIYWEPQTICSEKVEKTMSPSNLPGAVSRYRQQHKPVMYSRAQQ